MQYLADTADGAWAELLRHEEITEEEDLLGIERDLWAVDVPGDESADALPALSTAELTGGIATYPACQAEARRLRQLGARGLVAPSAALMPGAANGWRVLWGALRPGPPRDGHVVVLFGARPHLVGWRACSRGRPDFHVLSKVRPMTSH